MKVKTNAQIIKRLFLTGTPFEQKGKYNTTVHIKMTIIFSNTHHNCNVFSCPRDLLSCIQNNQEVERQIFLTAKILKADIKYFNN